jgi:hypothetical protein
MEIDEFTLRYAKRIWPGITTNTRILIAWSSPSSAFTVLGLKGTEAVLPIPCDDAEYDEWAYLERHDTLVLIQHNSHRAECIAKFTGEAWRAIEEHSVTGPIIRVEG